MDKQSICRAFNGLYQKIQVNKRDFPLNELASGSKSTLVIEYSKVLANMLETKGISCLTATAIASSLSFAIKYNCDIFQPDISSFHYEASDSINGEVVYWDVVLLVCGDTLILDILKKPNDDVRSEFIN